MIDKLIQDKMQAKGLDAVYRWNTLQPPYHSQGWPLALPEVQWTDSTRLVLHFQDRITASPQGCSELQAIEQHYKNRANQVVVIFYSHGLDQIYKGPVQLVEFSTHNWLTVTDLLRIKDQWWGSFNQAKSKHWQCLNGRICDHRTRAAAMLISWLNGTLSLGTKIALAEWHYGTYRGTENYENFVRLLPVYQCSAVNIVTETDYESRPGVICEKTLYAFVAKQVPIIIGHPGAVQDCRDMGFDMLDDLVDNSYDWLPNHQRVEAALTLNRDLILGKIDLAPWHPRLQANQGYVIDGFLKWMTDSASRDLDRIM